MKAVQGVVAVVRMTSWRVLAVLGAAATLAAAGYWTSVVP